MQLLLWRVCLELYLSDWLSTQCIDSVIDSSNVSSFHVLQMYLKSKILNPNGVHLDWEFLK